MQVVYNRQGIGDVLLLTLQQTKDKTVIENYGDVTRIAKTNSGEAVAYNIFNASNYIDVNRYDLLNIDQDFAKQMETIFKENGLEDVLNVNLSPKFVVGKIVSLEQHEDSNQLSVCHVDVDEEETWQIVCGAPNVAEGQKVVVAKVGAFMPSGLEITDSELRGVKSTGMICAARELNLPNAAQEKGILVLNDQEIVGKPFTVSMYDI